MNYIVKLTYQMLRLLLRRIKIDDGEDDDKRRGGNQYKRRLRPARRMISLQQGG